MDAENFNFTHGSRKLQTPANMYITDTSAQNVTVCLPDSGISVCTMPSSSTPVTNNIAYNSLSGKYPNVCQWHNYDKTITIHLNMIKSQSLQTVFWTLLSLTSIYDNTVTIVTNVAEGC